MIPTTHASGPVRRSPRPSFRDDVRKVISEAGLSGITREQVMQRFPRQPRVKVTVALNDLLGRREAYIRNGIYRITDIREN